jgi:hypothetical protein
VTGDSGHTSCEASRQWCRGLVEDIRNDGRPSVRARRTIQFRDSGTAPRAGFLSGSYRPPRLHSISTSLSPIFQVLTWFGDLHREQTPESRNNVQIQLGGAEVLMQYDELLPFDPPPRVSTAPRLSSHGSLHNRSYPSAGGHSPIVTHRGDSPGMQTEAVNSAVARKCWSMPSQRNDTPDRQTLCLSSMVLTGATRKDLKRDGYGLVIASPRFVLLAFDCRS